MGPSPTLSQLLKEAKASESVGEGKAGEGGSDEGPPLSYSRLFDEYHGKAFVSVSCPLLLITCTRCVSSRGTGAALQGVCREGMVLVPLSPW